jgi:hypothetical protein
MNQIKENLISIKNEEEFPHDNSNKYFCNQLCSVRNSCKYR